MSVIHKNLDLVPAPQNTSYRGCSVRRIAAFAITGAVISFCLFISLVNRIDFHPDEAIYLARVPVNLLNDSGVFYNAWYWLSTLGDPTPLSARLSCAMLGSIFIASLIFAFGIWFSNQIYWMFVAIPIIFFASYQGIFLIIRVRPELSWLCVSGVILASLVAVKYHPNSIFQFSAICALVLLPMNHRLSWIACACISGYLMLFGWKEFGRSFTLLAIVAMPVGVLLNFIIRPVLLGGSFETAIVEFIRSTEGGPRMPPLHFLHNVFWECSMVFTDTSATPNWWTTLLPVRFHAIANHHAIAVWLWAASCIQPFIAKTATQRYALSVPWIVLALMYAAGYFNPTYFSIFSIYSIMSFLFIALQTEQRTLVRIACGTTIVISIFNGTSFLSTRVLNHGRASFFDVERELRMFVRSLPPDTTIAVPERFQSIGTFHPGRYFVIYKDQVPENVDYMIIDQYDYEIYSRFISDYTAKQNQIDNATITYNLLATRIVPVYWRDKALPNSPNPKYELVQGSWFFRNGVNYRITILQHQSRSDDKPKSPAILFPG